MLVSLLFLGLGIFSGRVLIAINAEEKVPWNDPVLLATYGLFFWLLAAVVGGVFLEKGP